MDTRKIGNKARRAVVLAMFIVICVGTVSAGLLITNGNGITVTALDGITYAGPNGITVTALDGLLALTPNGVTAPTTSGITVTALDGLTYSGANGILATGVDGLTTGQSSGITVTALDGLLINSAGNSYQADSVLIHRANGITVTALDNLSIIGSDGVTAPGPDGLSIGRANGVTGAALDGIAISGADGITVTALDGQTYSISPGDLTIGGANGVSATDITNLVFTGADSITTTGLGETLSLPPGLQSVDPALATLLNRLTDDSNIDAAVIYHNPVTEADITTLRNIGVRLAQRYRVLPIVSMTTTKRRLLEISRLPQVRAIYGNRTLKLLAEPGAGLTGTARVKSDAELTAANVGRIVTGSGVTVAVLDTGLDATHADLSGRVIENVEVLGLPGLGNFNYPATLENVPNSDLISGHGTFVGGVIAGNGSRSSGRYTGVAPGARLVGVSVGDLLMLSVIEGFDYLLWKGPELGVKVVNCSFSADTLYDPNDPVNIATKMLTDRGVSVVVSAGNNGPGMDTLNPYAMAPWVISVGATDERGRVANFSSRGSFTKLSGPSLVAPGVNVVSLRAAGVNLNGLLGLGLRGDLSLLSAQDLLSYTVGSGTSFTAPQVAGTIALMLDVNPSLTPAQIRDILRRTATPMPPYFRYEVGAGMLNAHAAVLEAAFSARRMGMFRASLDRKQARYVNDPLRMFSGTVPLGALGLLGSFTSNINIPQNTLVASVQVAWGPEISLSDLSLQLTDPNGAARPVVNTLNLPVLTGRRERDLIKNPMPGTWRAKLTHTLIGLPQPFVGALETTRAEYPALTDIGGLTDMRKAEVYQMLRTFVMSTFGNRFRPQFAASRLDLASALVVGGRAPQYLAGQPRFRDATDIATRIMVESVQSAPGGPLFNDASPGGLFRPDDRVTRLTAAVALVRAAGLRSQAEAMAGVSLPLNDASSIPSDLRGYVKLALDRDLMTDDGDVFRPNDAMSRIELAHAMVGIARLAAQ